MWKNKTSDHEIMSAMKNNMAINKTASTKIKSDDEKFIYALEKMNIAAENLEKSKQTNAAKIVTDLMNKYAEKIDRDIIDRDIEGDLDLDPYDVDPFDGPKSDAAILPMHKINVRDDEGDIELFEDERDFDNDAKKLEDIDI